MNRFGGIKVYGMAQNGRPFERKNRLPKVGRDDRAAPGSRQGLMSTLVTGAAGRPPLFAALTPGHILVDVETGDLARRRAALHIHRWCF